MPNSADTAHSTSSHTHVDPPQPHLANSSPKAATPAPPSHPQHNTHPDRPPPPQCVQNCVHSIEHFTASIARFNDRIERSRTHPPSHHNDDGDGDDPPTPLWQQKLLIPLVFALLAWILAAYIWRLSAPLIRQSGPGPTLGSRAEGIGLLTTLVPLWLMAVWSYVKLISTPPGFANDLVKQSPPPAPLDRWSLDQQHQPASAAPIDITHADARPPYPRIFADADDDDNDDRYAVRGASSESMRVLPGSISANNLGGGGGSSNRPSLEGSLPMSPSNVPRWQDAHHRDDDDDESEQPEAHLASVLGGVGAAALGASAGAQQEQQRLDQDKPAPPTPQPPAGVAVAAAPHPAPAPAARPAHPIAPSRQPANNPPPLSAPSLYCHRCKLLKPPRTHHCRRCNACVLKMDHHCPWVGGCVGAGNQRFFFTFVLWVTILEVYVLVSTAVVFHRGVKSLGRTALGEGRWRVDGYLISVLAIASLFLLFTGALLGTHVFLLSHNLTTIEHLGVNRVKGREEVLLDRWFGFQSSLPAGSGHGNGDDGDSNGGGSGEGRRRRRKQGGITGLYLREKRAMRKRWDDEWGSWTREGNPWWLGGREEVGLATVRLEERTDDGGGGGGGVGVIIDRIPPPATATVVVVDGGDEEKGTTGQPSFKKRGARRASGDGGKNRRAGGRGRGAWKVNMSLALGEEVWMWFLPIGRSPTTGLEFPLNPRFGEKGVQRRREVWPEGLR